MQVFYDSLVTIGAQPACSAEGHASQYLRIPVDEPAIERTARTGTGPAREDSAAGSSGLGGGLRNGTGGARR